MKVTRNDKDFVCFDELNYYDVFLDGRNLVYLRIPRVIDMDDDQKYNAIDLINNDFWIFEDYDKVKKLNYELIIKD